MEYGLCCLFSKEPIKFKTFTLQTVSIEKVEAVYTHNIESLQKAFNFCAKNGIWSYRISSDLFPKIGTLLETNFFSLEFAEKYLNKLRNLETHNLILSFHPSQFVNMGSPDEKVIQNSVSDLKQHFLIAKYLPIREVNIHLGGTYGDKESAKKRFVENVQKYLNADEVELLTIENDELSYSVEDTLEVAKILGIRVTLDIHHHRCYSIKNPSEFSEKELVEMAGETWKNWGYQRMHISSPKDGYSTASKSRPHHDFIDDNDFPEWLLEIENLHLDIEAKEKEIAIFKLQEREKNVEQKI
ncbi:UV damage endonuclease UvdE [Thiovulum sp. ES]|nr:UV damage endonuclease UvdE [Thiovulum sp. ES]